MKEKINHHGKRADAIVKECCNIQAQAVVKKSQQTLMHWQKNIYAFPIMAFVQKRQII